MYPEFGYYNDRYFCIHPAYMSFFVIKGTIFKIQRHSLYDGPGIRTTVFFKGCPLHCLWCFNPESQSNRFEIVHNPIQCIGCGLCLKVCPVPGTFVPVPPSQVSKMQSTTWETITSVPTQSNTTSSVSARPVKTTSSVPKEAGISTSVPGKGARIPQRVTIDKQLCTNCGACTDVCPSGACSTIGYRIKESDLVEEIARDMVFFEQSGGGVTLSGGEVTAQPEFACSVLQQCRERGIHTAIETCGFTEWNNLNRIYRYTDLVLYDIKLLDSERHKRYTGADNRRILENAVHTAESGIRMIVRIPIIPGYTDDPEDIRATAAFIRDDLPGVDIVHLLPYEMLGNVKYERLGRRYALPSLTSPDESRLHELVATMEQEGCHVQIGG